MPNDTTIVAAAPPNTHPAASRLSPHNIASAIAYVLLAASAILFALHFLHLSADFPNHSPWVDWSKYTDEGWYGDAAIRHYFTGHWYWKGDFNPAVALPVWPAIELIVFKFTGVSPTAARALTLVVFALTLLSLYLLIERHTRPHSAAHASRALAAPITVFLLCASPFLYVFERMAILEPLLILLTVLALLAASHLHPLRPSLLLTPYSLPSASLALLLPAMVLTKTTAICLVPAIAYMVWARAGYRIRPALRLALPPFAAGLALWCAYFFLYVRPHYLADYRYLFSANAYTGIELQPLATTILTTLSDGLWMGAILFPALFAVLALAFFLRPRLLTNPLFPTLLLWISGYFAFLIYHNNMQPRYFLVVAVPITAVVALGIDSLRQLPSSRIGHIAASTLAAVIVLAIAIPDILLQSSFIAHPTYDFLHAAQSIQRIVDADTTHSHLILSISGSDITLMTGLPSIDDDFGTLDLDKRVQQYRPGWYVAWNEVDDDKADALNPLYKLQRVAAFPVMDDPDRDLLILYRLDPHTGPTTPQPPHKRRHTPKALITKMGQQPSVTQLEH
jgi:hypothetical protein